MLLKKLTEASGVSGNEKEVRDLIVDEIKPHVDELRVDRIGNIVAIKKSVESKYNIIISAHMDEVGLIVRGIDESGLIKFTDVGGIDARILVSKTVLIGKNKIPGVIGAKAVHLQNPSESKNALTINNLYIDIGASSKADAEDLISIGDYISFDSNLVEFGQNRIKAKALDNRVGCAILIELLKSSLPITIIAAFTVQEEIGLRGAAVAVNQFNAHLAIILEGTTCSDVTNVEEHLQVTELDKGPAISLMDKTSIYLRKYVDFLVETANENNIPWQYRKTSFGGNDAGRFHIAKAGTPCVSISVPCRYIHSPASVLSKDDYIHTKKLTLKFIEKISKGGLL